MRNFLLVFVIVLLTICTTKAQTSLYSEVNANLRNFHLAAGLQQGEVFDIPWYLSAGMEYNYREQFAPTLLFGIKFWNPKNSVYIQYGKLHNFPMSVGYRRDIFKGLNVDLNLHPKYPTVGVTWMLQPEVVELSTAFGCY
jgi:hypothetical protein